MTLNATLMVHPDLLNYHFHAIELPKLRKTRVFCTNISILRKWCTLGSEGRTFTKLHRDGALFQGYLTIRPHIVETTETVFRIFQPTAQYWAVQRFARKPVFFTTGAVQRFLRIHKNFSCLRSRKLVFKRTAPNGAVQRFLGKHVKKGQT